MRNALQAAETALREGRLAESLRGYEAALSAAVRDGTAADVAEILRRIGSIHHSRGELEIAAEVLEASRTVAELNGLGTHLASAVICLAVVAQSHGELPQAEIGYQTGRELAAELGDDRLVLIAEQNLATLASIRGDLPLALDCYASSLSRQRDLGDSFAIARTLHNMGMAHAQLGQPEQAEQHFDEAFQIAERSRDTELLAHISLNRAELQLRRGDHGVAREACDLAYEIYGRLESMHGTAEAHKLYGILYRETAKPRLAGVHLDLAVELAQQSEIPLLEAEAEAERALLFLGESRNPEALRCLNRAHRIFARLQARRDIADIDERLDGLETTFLEVTQSWAESIESKDAYTAGHCQRVADYACLVAEAVGIAGRELIWFRMGALLHDVGKIRVPAAVLNKPGKLDEEEWECMRGHTTAGDEIVAQLDFPWDIRPLVRSHHEHWAGTGYPDGLAGEDIPLYARILCVADVYDALTTTRSYRPALSRHEALRIMDRDAGRIFDPELLSLFKRLTAEPAACRTPPRSAAPPPAALAV